MHIVIRKMNVTDAASVAEIEARAFSQPWPQSEFEKAAVNENYCYIIAESKGRVVGYAGCTTVCDEADITNIAVDCDFRQNGIGSKLLEVLIEEAHNKGAYTIYLEVRLSNISAQALYKKHGFTEIGRRPGFYQKPNEDAILMSKNII